MSGNEVSVFGKEIKIGEKAIRINGRRIKMGEKVVITREQGKAVENLKKLNRNLPDIFSNLRLIDEKLRGDLQWEDKEIEEANTIPDSEFIKLLYYGYQVEDPFKVGDWVVHNISGVTAKAEYIDDDEVRTIDKHRINTFPENFRHATESEISEEKERRKWERASREVGEYKIGDIVKIEGRGFHGINYVNDLGGIKVRYLLKMFDKDECELICFVEDRKDEGYYQ